MKPGYDVVNVTLWIDDNCIIVSNYTALNKVVNYPWELKSYKRELTSDIGIWKIKKLKKLKK